jgi:hypothetical protein
VIETAWEAAGFDGKPGGKQYSALVLLVQQHGIPKVERWCVWLRSNPLKLPEGAQPQPFFATCFRTAMSRDFLWDPVAQQQRGKPGRLLPPLPASRPNTTGRRDWK